MSTETTTDPLPYPATLLDSEGVVRILIIDDAFDDPSVDTVGTDAIQEFLGEIDGNPAAAEELRNLELAADSLEVVDDQYLTQLWQAFETLTVARRACEVHLFRDLIDKRAEVEPLVDLLRRELGREVVCVGSNPVLEDTSAKIIFLDYFLGAKTDKEAVETSQSFAEEIHSRYKEENKERPLIILMSSRVEVEAEKERFREETGLLGGMFEFILKAELSDRKKLFLRLAALVKALPFGYEVQHFVDAISAGLQTASVEFLKAVRSLGISDYTQIQLLSLKEDGTPLGDYMLWLYSSYLGHLLFEKDAAVRGRQKALNRLLFDSVSPTDTIPSSYLGTIYHSALFASSDEVAPHPQAPDGFAVRPHLLQLGLGDLFLDESSGAVWTVLNCDCDLAESPAGERKLDREQSVVLLPGKLMRLTENTGATALRTELFSWSGHLYRIVWFPKRVEAVAHYGVQNWMESRKCSRVARLRPQFALQLQRAFAADLTRVGLPVAPPISQRVAVQLGAPVSDGGTIIVSIPDVACVTHDRKRTRLILTVPGAVALKEAVEKSPAAIEQYQQSLDVEDPKTRSRSSKCDVWKRDLAVFLQQFDRWYAEQGIFDMPRDGELKRVGEHPLMMAKNLNIQEQREWQQPLVLNIVDLPESE